MRPITFLFQALVVLSLECCSEARPVVTSPEVGDFPIEVPAAEPKDYGLEMVVPTDKLYRGVKQEIRQLRERLNTTALPADTLGATFTAALLNRIIPYWYGTRWSFEGHTSKPGEGEIACGYFVSTTLRDVGVVLNRYRLAQQAPLVEAKTLALGQTVLEIALPSTAANIAAIRKALPQGIHFIGFDSGHVGFICKVEEELFLIHSNYLSGGVMVEEITQSMVFPNYGRYYLVPLTTNERLLKRWLDQEEIEVLAE